MQLECVDEWVSHVLFLNEENCTRKLYCNSMPENRRMQHLWVSHLLFSAAILDEKPFGLRLDFSTKIAALYFQVKWIWVKYRCYLIGKKQYVYFNE